MSSWEIKPTISVNGIAFGDTRQNVRKSINLDYKEFKKTSLSANTTDNYGFCHFFYDKNDCFVAVEFFDGIELTIDNKHIFPGKLSEIQSAVDDLEYDGYGYISKNKSIGISANGSEIESILFGKKDYYN